MKGMNGKCSRSQIGLQKKAARMKIQRFREAQQKGRGITRSRRKFEHRFISCKIKIFAPPITRGNNIAVFVFKKGAKGQLTARRGLVQVKGERGLLI